MGNRRYKFEVIFFFTLVFRALASNSVDHRFDHPAHEEICRALHYRKSSFEDKPNLIVMELHEDANDLIYMSGICKMTSDQNESGAKYITTPASLLNYNLEYDSQEGVLYRAAHDEIEKFSLAKIDNFSTEYILPDRSSIVSTIALNPISKNLYYVQSGKLKVVKVDEKSIAPRVYDNVKIKGDPIVPVVHHDIKLDDDWHNEEEKLKPEFNPAVKVFPSLGYLVVKDSNSSLIVVYEDGSSQRDLYHNTSVKIGAITADNFDGNIYWVEADKEGSETRIRFININDKNARAKTFHVHGNLESNYSTAHIQVDNKYVYFVKEGLTPQDKLRHLLRAKKADGSVDEEFELLDNHAPSSWVGTKKKGKFLSILVLNDLIVKDHPCQVRRACHDDYCVVKPDENGKLERKCLQSEKIPGKTLCKIKYLMSPFAEKSDVSLQNCLNHH